MIGAWRAKLQRSMWPAAVVVGAVLGKDGPQMALAEDQDAVSELDSGGQDESFREAVRPRTSRWDLHGVDAGAGHDSVERGGELACSVADEEPEGGGTVVEVHQQIAGLLGGPCSGRVAGRPQDVHVAGRDLEGEEDVDPFEGDPSDEQFDVLGCRRTAEQCERAEKPAEDQVEQA
jgi:hypothetical protein